MYEIFESQVDNIEISREYNYLRNYKIEEINGGGGSGVFCTQHPGCFFKKKWVSENNGL